MIVMSLDAPLELAGDASNVTLERYQTALIPAAARWCTVRAGSGESAPFMFVTPPESREELPRACSLPESIKRESTLLWSSSDSA